MTDTEGIEATVSDVVARHGRIDILVNNAGRAHVGAVEETTDAELRALFDVHVFDPAALSRTVLPHMRARRSGAIVQLSSMGAQMSFPGLGAYSARSSRWRGCPRRWWTHALRDQVLVVEPGTFRTGLFRARSTSEETGPYAETVGPTRRMTESNDGTAPGDPDKAAAAILTALNAEHTPLRLPLGGRRRQRHPQPCGQRARGDRRLGEGRTGHRSRHVSARRSARSIRRTADGDGGLRLPLPKRRRHGGQRIGGGRAFGPPLTVLAVRAVGVPAAVRTIAELKEAGGVGEVVTADGHGYPGGGQDAAGPVEVTGGRIPVLLQHGEPRRLALPPRRRGPRQLRRGAPRRAGEAYE